MRKPKVYEVNENLYGYEHLEGKNVEVQFLPNERSKKWRTTRMEWCPLFSWELAEIDILNTARNYGWYSWRVREKE